MFINFETVTENGESEVYITSYWLERSVELCFADERPLAAGYCTPADVAAIERDIANLATHGVVIEISRTRRTIKVRGWHRD